MKFFYASGSCSFASHVALEEAGAKYEAHKVSLANNEQRSDSYLRINPLGRVPALVVGDTAISETIAILTYISTRFPEAKLLPDNTEKLGKAYQLMSWFASSVHVSFAQIFRSERFADDSEVRIGLKASGKDRFGASLDRIEQLLAGKEWILPHYSVLDPYVSVFYRWAPRLEFDMTAYPAWTEHFNRVVRRPAVQRVLEVEAR